MIFQTSHDAWLFRSVSLSVLSFRSEVRRGQREVNRGGKLEKPHVYLPAESHPGGTSSPPPPLFASTSLYKCQGGLSPLHTAIVQTHSLWRCFSVSFHAMNCWWWKKKTLLPSVPQAREPVNNAAEGLGERERRDKEWFAVVTWKRSALFFPHHAVNWNEWRRVCGARQCHRFCRK